MGNCVGKAPPPGAGKDKKKELSSKPTTNKQQEQKQSSSVDAGSQHKAEQQQLAQANGERDATATVKPVASSKGQGQQEDGRGPSNREGSKGAQQGTQQLQQYDDEDEIQQAPSEPREQIKQQQSSSKQQPLSVATPSAAQKAPPPEKGPSPEKVPEVSRPPPQQPYDSERNTAHDDAASDSDLSDPGEYEKYGPSNSDEDAVDEQGNLIPKEDGLPKGMDTAGVEGGKFTNSGRPAGRYHAAESPLFSDNESQMSDVRQFKSITELGTPKPKQVPASSLSYSHPMSSSKEAEPPGAQTNFAYKDDGDEDEELDHVEGNKGQAEGSIKSSNTSSSVDPPNEADANEMTPQKGVAPGEGQDLKGQESITAQAGTPAAESAPRYASLLPARTPKATTAPEAPAAGEQDQAQGGSEGQPERLTSSVVSQGEASGSSSPRATPAPRYASLVPPRKKGHSATPSDVSSIANSELGKQEVGGAAAQSTTSTTSTPPRYASLVPPRKTPKAKAPAEPTEQAEKRQEHQEEEQHAAQQKEQQQKEEQAAQDAQQKEQQQALESQKQAEQQQREMEQQQQKEQLQQQQQQQQRKEQLQKQQQQQQQQQQEARGAEGLSGREEHAPPCDPEAAMHEQADKEGEEQESDHASNSQAVAVAAQHSQHQQQLQQQQQQQQQQQDGEPSPGVPQEAWAEKGDEGRDDRPLARTSHTSMHSMDQNSRLQARKAERASRVSAGDSQDGATVKPRPAAPVKPGLPRFMQPTVASEHLLNHQQQQQQQQQQTEEHSQGAGRAAHARPFSAIGMGSHTKGGSALTHSSMASLESADAWSARHHQRPKTAEVPGLPRFMQPTAATASLFGQSKEAEARIQAAHEHHLSHHNLERSAGKSVERRRGAGSNASLHSSTNASDLHEGSSKAASLAFARPKPDTTHLPRFMQPTVAAQAHTIHGHQNEAGHERPSHSKIDISALHPQEEPDSTAQEDGVKGRVSRSGLPQPARATTPQQQRLQQRGAATSRGSRLPMAEAASPEPQARPQSARASTPPDPSSLPRFMQPTTAAKRHQGMPVETEVGPTPPKQGVSRAPAGRPGTAPPGGRTPPTRTSVTPKKGGTPAALSVAGNIASQEEAYPHTPNNHDQGHPQQQQQQGAGSATPPPGSGGLPYGEWSLVRLKKEMPCDACKGTAEQETVDGEKDVFQCDQVLEPKSLAVVISHEVKKSEAEGGGTAPKTWVFCPDPLCLDSQPEGSNLPERPPKIQLRGGTKISRTEFNNLKELGLEVGSSTPATTPHADPSTPQTPASNPLA